MDVPLSDADSRIESPGTVILVIDETQKVALATELDRLEDDLSAEGWDVAVVDDVNPADTIESVRDKIFEIWDAPGADVTAVFLIVHIPVPMSGNSNPDGHGVRPMPADVFYGDMDSDWALGTNADGASAVFAIDLDGDEDMDVLSASYGDDTIAWYENDGSEGFTSHTIASDADFAKSVFAIDLDGDGNDDILSASLVVNASAGTTSSGAWGTLSGFFGPAENPTPTEPEHINVWKWKDTNWSRRMTLAPGRRCGRPRWTTLSLAI